MLKKTIDKKEKNNTIITISTLRKAGWEPELLRIRAGDKNIYTF